MNVEFVTVDRLQVIGGGEQRFSELVRRGDPPSLDATATIVMPTDDEDDEYLLFTQDELEDIVWRARRGQDWRPLLRDHIAGTVVGGENRPDEPTVVLLHGEVAGAWVPSAPPMAAAAPPPPPAAPPPAPGAGGGIASYHYLRPDGPPPPKRGRGLGGLFARRRRRGPRAAKPAESAPPAPAIPAAAEPGVDAPMAAAVEGADPGEPTIRRTPHLDAPDEIDTKPDTVFTVKVRTDTAPLRPEEEGTDVVIDAPPEVTSVELGVVLTVTEHFVVDGDPYKPLTIERDEPDSESVSFVVRVSGDPSNRNAGIQAVFLYRGRPCGQVGREWDWDPQKDVARAATAAPAAPTSLPVHVRVEEPDLSVIVTAPVNDGMHFQCLVETPLLDEYSTAKVADFGLPIQARTYVKNLLGDLVDASMTPAQRREALDTAGYKLFDAAPPLFQEVLWALVDSGKKPKTIYIASVEPNLPWELMIPSRPPDKQPSVLKPLGVEFAVGRWTRADSKSPPQLMPVRDAFVVAPEYEGARKLDTAGEVEMVEKLLRGRRVEPAKADYLNYFFADNHASLLHFACHGATDVDDDDAIYLDKDEVLRSIQVRASESFQALCADRAPLVFLNACEAGQTVPSLGGGAGFPYAFGMIGARGVVAPLWPVDDKLAHEVAKEIYETALKPDAPPIAEIMRRIRERAYAKPDADTYAAYCFYGDPLAKLELVD